MTTSVNPLAQGDLAQSGIDDAAAFDDFIEKADRQGQAADGSDGHAATPDIDPDTALDTQEAGSALIAPRTLILPQVRDPKPQPPEPSATDRWKSILGDDQGDIAESLAKPVDMAQRLYDNWDNWAMKGVKFSSPPDSMPDDGKETLKFFADSNTSRRALDNNFDDGKRSDDIITRREVGIFIERARSDVKEAANAFGDHLGKDGGGDETAKALAKSAAILMGNQSLVAASGERMLPHSDNQRQNNEGIHPSNFRGVEDDSSLSHELKEAAALWSKTGMREMLDVAGGNQATVSTDTVIGRDNISNWIRNAAPKDVSQTLDVLQQAALNELGNDVSNLLSAEDKANFFDNLDNHPPRVKAGVLVELTQAATRLDAGHGAGLWGEVQGSKLDDNFDAVNRELTEKIALLAKDPDVQEEIQEARNYGTHRIVKQSPELEKQIANHFDEQFKQGKFLDNVDLSKLDDGKDISADDANDIGKKLLDFAQQAGVVDIALGGTGNVDLTQALAEKGRLDQLKEVYESRIKTGDALSEQIESGGSRDDAFKDFGTSIAGYTTALAGGNDDGVAGPAELLGSFGSVLAQNATIDDFAPFQDGDGHIDEGKIAEYIEDARKGNPDLFVDDTGAPISAVAVASVTSSMVNLVKDGMSTRDALAQLGAIGKGTDKVSDGLEKAFSNGTLHGVGVVAATGVFLTRTLSGQPQTPLEGAAIAASALQMFGAAGNASKVISSGAGALLIDELATSAFKSLGPTLGAAGGAIGSVVGIIGGVKDLKAGNTAAGALGVTGGVVGAGLAVVEGAAAVAGLLGLSGAATLGAISSVLGPVGFAVGVGVTVAQLVMNAAVRANQTQAYVENVGDTLLPYGIGVETESRKREPADPLARPSKF